MAEVKVTSGTPLVDSTTDKMTRLSLQLKVFVK
jgi:hypothetical protein